MATYKVKSGQNIFDVALHLYGTVEGLFDLLISNPKLSMCSDLETGMDLEYHEDFVINSDIINRLNEGNIMPANGQGYVYHKPSDKEARLMIKVPQEIESIQFLISGNGKVIVDWDDNTELEEIVLNSAHTHLEHHFNNKTEKRRVLLYGDFSLQTFDTSKLEGDVILLCPLVVDEFTSKSNGYSLAPLFLFKDTYKVDLQNRWVDSLEPIYDMSLSQLNLCGITYQNIGVLDEYLENIVKNHQNRRACEVWLSSTPSERGMQAIETIIGEPEWNTPNKWIFHINDILYTAE